MLKQILQAVNKEAQSVVGFTSGNMQRCFAINSGVNDMLDVARKNYLELIENMKGIKIFIGTL